MTLKDDAKLKKKKTRGLKNDIGESLKICTLMGSFFPRHIKL